MLQALFAGFGQGRNHSSDGLAFKARAAESLRVQARDDKRRQAEALEKVRPLMDSLYEERIKPFLASEASRGNTSPTITIQASYLIMEDPFRLCFDTYLEYWAFGQLLPAYLKGKGYRCKVDDRSRINGYDERNRVEYRFTVS